MTKDKNIEIAPANEIFAFDDEFKKTKN